MRYAYMVPIEANASRDRPMTSTSFIDDLKDIPTPHVIGGAQARLGETDDGVLLLREVLRNMPNHALARRLMDEWTAKPGKAAADPADDPQP